MNYKQKIRALKKVTKEKLPKKKSILRKILEDLGFHMKEIESNFDIHPNPEIWLKCEFTGNKRKK